MKKLKNGWVEGSVKEFLGLTDADLKNIDARLAKSRPIKKTRAKGKKVSSR